MKIECPTRFRKHYSWASLALAMACLASPLAAEDTRVPKWDARGLGLLPPQGIACLDVSDDGSRIVVGTIAPAAEPSVHVLDAAGKILKSYRVGQRWIGQVAAASGDQAFAMCMMPNGSAFDEPTTYACGESTLPIVGGTGGISLFHYGDHSNHVGKQLRSYSGGAVTLNENQILWLDVAKAEPAPTADAARGSVRNLSNPTAKSYFRNLKPTVLSVHRSGVALVGGHADGDTKETKSNNLFLFRPGTQTPIWSRPIVAEVAESTAPELGEYGRPLLADGSRGLLPQRDEPISAPLSIGVTRDSEFSESTSRVATADYRGWQRWVRSSATGVDTPYGVRFMPAKPTITVYDGGGKVVRRFDAAKFSQACWVDLEFLPGGRKLLAYPHHWTCRGLAGQSILPADDRAQTMWLLDIETGEIRTREFPDAIASLAVADDGTTAIACWNGRVYRLAEAALVEGALPAGIEVGKPALVKFDRSGKRLIAATTSGEILNLSANAKAERLVDLAVAVPTTEKSWIKNANGVKLAQGLWELPGGRVESDLGGQRIIEAPDGLILLEGHAGLSFEREWKAIESVGLDPRRIKYVLATHEHGDHAPGAYLWRVATGAQFICSREMAYTLQHQLPDGTGYGLHPPVPTDIKIDEERVLDLAGLRVVALRLPGHTFGSMGWLFERDGKRFVAIGDLIMPEGRLGYAGSINFSPQQVLESLRKLDSLRVDTVLPGHGPVVGPDKYVAAGIAFGMHVGWGKMTPEKPDPRFRIHQSNVLVTGFLSGAVSADFGDIDGDGLPDVAVVSPDGERSIVKVFLNRSEREGLFDPMKADFEIPVPDIGLPQKIRLRTLNGDRRGDFFVVGRAASALLSSRDQVGAYDIKTFSVQEPYQLRVVDRKESGAGRVVAFGQFSGAQVVTSDPAGRLRAEPLTPTLKVPYADIRELDLNGDGRLDWVSNDGSVRLRDASDVIPEAATLRLQVPSSGEWLHLGVGDVNGDRKPDVIITEREGKILAFHNTGDARVPFAAQPSTTLELKPEGTLQVVHARDAATVADWNGDGFDDLLFGLSQRDEVRVFLGSAAGLGVDRTEKIVLDYLLHFEHSVTVADFNADGRPDLACFAIVQGGPATPFIWLQPSRAK
ncbi:MAG: FG-GAP-like repeat-containing protein [Planctomycetia bacterium]|nr:FG-GAP-like repeat-containing protein [Planctomycetia bacterium]